MKLQTPEDKCKKNFPAFCILGSTAHGLRTQKFLNFVDYGSPSNLINTGCVNIKYLTVKYFFGCPNVAYALQELFPIATTAQIFEAFSAHYPQPGMGAVGFACSIQRLCAAPYSSSNPATSSFNLGK